MELSSEWILSLAMRICLLISLSFALASSAISSSEIIQRLISRLSDVSGSIASNIVSRQSRESSSVSRLPYVFTRLAVLSIDESASSSLMPRLAPISSRLRDMPTSLRPENDTPPFFTILKRASEVSLCAFRIASISVIGVSLRHSSFPISEAACSDSISIILVYSRILNAFSFITNINSLNVCITYILA